GDLLSLAATVPGVGITPDGRLTVFGVPGQVSTTFNGMSFGGSEIPRDARVQVRVITSTYDPSIGGFAGLRINAEMGQGGRVTETFGRVTLDAPPLQYADASANRLGQRFTRGELNGDTDGPFGS